LDRFDQPRANLPYVLVIGFATFRGTTNAQGELKHPIPPNARRGRITLGSGNDIEKIELHLGHLNPTNTTSGAQARLTNLGLDCGPIDGILGPKTRKALRRFQKLRDLKQTGELDGPTIKELETRHGS
jgi:type VI secretion system secreted protein VgrG